MKGGQPALFGQRLPGNHDDLVGRYVVGALLHAAAAEQAFGHGQVGLVVQVDIAFQQVLGQGDLAAGHRRLPAEGGKGRAVGTAGTALDAFFQLILDPLERVACVISHKVIPLPVSHLVEHYSSS